MTITTTQRHTPAESVNERTSGRRIDAVQQFASFRITETGNTDAAGKFTITHTPIGSLARQFDTLSRINREPDLVALTANDQTLYTGGFDQDNKTIELYTDVAKTTPAENLVGVKVSYWYYAPIKGTLNDDGTFTPEAIITPVDSDGNEKFTDANPGAVQLTGSIETVNDNPVTGIKTVTAIAAEIFAGGSAKTNRRKLIVKNEDQSLRLRIGKSDVTQQNGYPVEPGATVEFQFDPNVAVPIYAISEGANLKVAVMEI